MAVLNWSERALGGGRDPAAGVRAVLQPEDRLGSNGVGEERLARECCQEVGVWMIIGGMTGRDHGAPGMIRLDMTRNVMRPMHADLPVSKAVACLREEDAKTHHDREQDGWETGRAHAAHDSNITDAPGGGSRRAATTLRVSASNFGANRETFHPFAAFFNVRACGEVLQQHKRPGSMLRELLKLPLLARARTLLIQHRADAWKEA